MENERLCQLALSLAPGVGNIIARQLISYCGSAREVFDQNNAWLLKIPRIGRKIIEGVRHPGLFERARKEMDLAARHGYQILFFTESGYPERLKQIPDAPAVLFFQGKVNWENPRVVSIVGTRRATSYGLAMVSRIMNDLSPYQPLIVSGLAYGIDIQAHKEAVNAGLPTVAVMAGGVNRIYPAEHRPVIQKFLTSGGILTEHPWNTQPEAHNFPRRNRIIAGLSDLTLVVEAAEKGGALITAELANDYNREVFAVPGNIDRPWSSGCNRLIGENKAHIFRNVHILTQTMLWDDLNVKKRIVNDPKLPENEKSILNTLKNAGGSMHIDQLCWKTQLKINTVATDLINLELKGFVIPLPGKFYKIK